MDYETYTGNACLSSSVNNEYTKRCRLQARARAHAVSPAIRTPRPRRRARESVGRPGRLIFADETNCAPLVSLTSFSQSRHDWNRVTSGAGYMALDLRGAAVNAADWKTPCATSRGLSRCENLVRTWRTYCKTCSIGKDLKYTRIYSMLYCI